VKTKDRITFVLVRNALIESGGSSRLAAELIGRHPRTIRNYTKKWPQLKKYLAKKEVEFPDSQMSRRHPDA